MSVNGTVLDNALVERLARGFPRSPLQKNGLGECDAELVRLPGCDVLLALTTDAVVEEIETGLYRDPYLIGWMTVIVNASDLAAVGADTIGLLLNQTLPRNAGEAFLERLQRGVGDACAACGLHVLGGDTNSSAWLHMEATAIGTVPPGEALTRSGCRAGDHLYASAPLGLGSAFAFDVLTCSHESRAGDRRAASVPFLPIARLMEGRLLRRYASCCMDTSDGAIATLDELMRRSEVGFKIDVPAREILHPAAARVSVEAGLPPWMLLAGPHGEFELLFAVPARVVPAFRRAAAARGWEPLSLGRARSLPGLELSAEDGCIALDTAAVRNLARDADADVDSYVAGLLSLQGADYGGA
jgi:thiamine-monophosphate kinase